MPSFCFPKEIDFFFFLMLAVRSGSQSTAPGPAAAAAAAPGKWEFVGPIPASRNQKLWG